MLTLTELSPRINLLCLSLLRAVEDKRLNRAPRFPSIARISRMMRLKRLRCAPITGWLNEWLITITISRFLTISLARNQGERGRCASGHLRSTLSQTENPNPNRLANQRSPMSTPRTISDWKFRTAANLRPLAATRAITSARESSARKPIRTFQCGRRYFVPRTVLRVAL